MNTRLNHAAGVVALALLSAGAAQAGGTLLAIGTLSDATDLSVGTSGLLENGNPGNSLGGIGSGLAWAGGNTFLALPDRGPNAVAYAPGNGDGTLVDNTTSYISRYEQVQLSLTATPSGGLPFTLTPVLTGTTLFYSPTALTYGATAGLPSAVPALNTANQFYFTGRSDGFNTTVSPANTSLNPGNARLDPESIRVSKDGQSAFVSDEYGPYVYQFDRATGMRTKTFTLPDHFGIANQSSHGATEISGNTSGRVANKGMEGLAITPDGNTLVGFVQSPLIQDGGDGGRMNRIVTIDIATGATHEYAYDNYIASTNKNYNSSEILAVNSHEFLILERDGKGLGDGSTAVVKKVFKVDLSGATDVSSLSGEASLLPYAVARTELLDIKAALGAAGITATNVPAKLEGMAFGEDVMVGSVLEHTLYIANDNDFVPDTAGPNKYYVFGFTDAELPGFQMQVVPVPAAGLLLTSALGFLAARRRRA